MMNRLVKCLTSALPLLLASACTGGSETGNPVTSTQLGLSLHTSDPATADVRAGAGGIVIESAWVSVSDLTLVRLAALGEDESEIEIEGPVVVDLRDARGALQEFALSTDVYARVEAQLTTTELPLPVGAPAELEGNAMVVTGLTPEGRRFTLVVSMEAELQAEGAAQGFTIDETFSRLVLSFDLARWFEGIDLDALAVGGDGTVRVDQASHPEALEAFEANLLEALELGRDRNGNAILDEDEERVAFGVAP